MWYWHNMGPFGWTMMVVFWGSVVALIVWAVYSTRPARRVGLGALEILERRLAEGEIGVEEFEDRRKVLASHP